MKQTVLSAITIYIKKILKDDKIEIRNFDIDKNNVILFFNYYSIRVQFFNSYFRIYDVNSMQKGFIQQSYDRNYAAIFVKLEFILKTQDKYYKDRVEEKNVDFKNFKNNILLKHVESQPILNSLQLLNTSQMGQLYKLGEKLFICIFCISRVEDNWEYEIMINTLNHILPNEKEKYKHGFETFIRLLTNTQE